MPPHFSQPPPGHPGHYVQMVMQPPPPGAAPMLHMPPPVVSAPYAPPTSTPYVPTSGQQVMVPVSVQEMPFVRVRDFFLWLFGIFLEVLCLFMFMFVYVRLT